MVTCRGEAICPANPRPALHNYHTGGSRERCPGGHCQGSPLSTLLSPAAGAACFTSEGNCQHWTAYGQPPAAWQGKEATSYPPNQYWQLGVRVVVAWWHTLDMWSSKNALSSYACLSYPHVSIMLYATLLSNLFLDVVLNLV